MENKYSWYKPDSDYETSEHYTPNKDLGHNLAENVSLNNFNSASVVEKNSIRQKVRSSIGAKEFFEKFHYNINKPVFGEETPKIIVPKTISIKKTLESFGFDN